MTRYVQLNRTEVSRMVPRARRPLMLGLGVQTPLCMALLGLLAFGSAARAADIKVAVAANFADPFKEIAAKFEASSGHRLVASLGATGQFYAQIVEGAPFDILLAADRATSAKAVREGYAVAGTAYTYAVGKLVLYSPTAGVVDGAATLKAVAFTRLAIANPNVAPYGVAAVETMQALDVLDALRPKLVQGNSIAQTFQFIATGNAELGFVALSQIATLAGGSRWIVPETMHAPISQDAVVMTGAKEIAAAQAFLTFLKTPQARSIIEKYGYGGGD